MFDKGIAGVTNDSVGLFNFTINGLKQLISNSEVLSTKAQEDTKSLLKLQK
jgi:hypothetical protein